MDPACRFDGACVVGPVQPADLIAWAPHGSSGDVVGYERHYRSSRFTMGKKAPAAPKKTEEEKATEKRLKACESMLKACKALN